MCGIAGIFNYADPDRPVDRELLVRMTRSLAHRGPDAEGFHFTGNVGLGHRRLSIVDLSPTGAQPMPNDDASCWLCYNGEFYNHRQFRPGLEAKGAHFRGPSDTETLLRLMESEGPESLANVSGIFGFAYWDGRNQALTLARDQLGVKQVYYHDDGRRIAFASEIKALLQDPSVPRRPDPEAVGQYLHFHTALFERTFFRDIKVVRAGEFLRVTRYGASVRTYWSLDDFSKSPGSAPEQVRALQSELSQVVDRQLMADVPVGSFFSGGIDSCAIAANAAQLGKKPLCFGVHFTGQGVIDERPYQEAAAQALGLDLQLITMDGAEFPDEFRRLMYHQDEPVLGHAMFPMAKVSALAASQVKVCLGGQAADEIFGGYGRYALGRPMKVLKSMLTRKGQADGNLTKQFAEGGTIARLARNLKHLANWEVSYFEHFAKVPQSVWSGLFADPAYCSRADARQLFHDVIRRSKATDPVDKLMHWDTQTYLTGLFHQDDRMSMAASLESRVPFADQRMVRFAFHVDPDLKLRGGSSKWILREAVADVLPPLVLNRRKVGFDTPAHSWMTGPHAGFVRDTLLSSAARQRGLWNTAGVEALLDHPEQRGWFDIVWKLMSIELWASIFLDGVALPPPERIEPVEAHPFRAAYLVQECRELGFEGTRARALWELKTRSGLVRLSSPALRSTPREFAARLPFTAGPGADLEYLASEATRGRIQCFGRWMADYGNPIDWHRDPVTGHRWPSGAHWSKALADAGAAEVKFTWEAGRFPQAYIMARAGVPELAGAFEAQLLGFMEANPPGFGIHWFSGQEVAIRLLAWLFGYHVFGTGHEPLFHYVAAAGAHLSAHIEYARDSVANNHLLMEALGLLVAGRLLSHNEWVVLGMGILTDQAPKQIHPDGASIQDSHNYERAALETYLWAVSFLRANGEEPPVEWLAAMKRGLDFLFAHQNPWDGRLPNFGANDGSRPLLLDSCDLGDFRPLLQALSVATRGERLYEPGPWDEMAMWLYGPVGELPLRTPRRRSVSFAHSGYHVLRGAETFAAFRCGSLLERYAQMDMLHLDVWWRGYNVLVDGGSYRYNGAPYWHNYFLRTASHNTVEVDGLDQMVHFRQFKTLYRTEAKMLRFEDALCIGEHYGYRRETGCTHRREVRLVDGETWIVTDTILGTGIHEARLHWLCGDFPWEFDGTSLVLQTPAGGFRITVSEPAEVVEGWQSLYYGEKVPVPSLVVKKKGQLPITFVTTLGPAETR